MLHKSQHKSSNTGQTGTSWCLLNRLSSYSARSWTNILRLQLWGHDDELTNRNSDVGLPLGCHLSTQKKKKIRRFCIPESGADDSRHASSPKKLSIRLRLTAFSLIPTGTSNAGRQRKAHPPENLAHHQECIFIYFKFARFYLKSISNTFS